MTLLAVTAWADPVERPAVEVNGSRRRWAVIIAINWLGPLARFGWCRRKTHR